MLYSSCVDNLGSSLASFTTIYMNINYFCFLNNLLVDGYISFFPDFLSSNMFSANEIIVLCGVYNHENVAAV